MQARDLMTTDLITVTADASMTDVAKLMVERSISGIPVVDGDRLLGIVTESDILVRAKRLDLPTFLPLMGGLLYLKGPDRLESELQKLTATRADEVMTKKVHAISPDTTLEDIATIMVERKVNRLPVIADDKLVGLITRSDVVKAIAQDLE